MSSLQTNNPAVETGVTVTLSTLIVTNIIGNTLVILIILTNKSMKSPMNYLLVNLAIADIMVGIFFAPPFILNKFLFHPDGKLGNVLCSLLTGGNMAWIGTVASSFTLISIGFERCVAVLSPFASNINTNSKKLIVTVAVCWVFAIVLNIPLFLTKVYNSKTKICSPVWPQEFPWFEAVYLITWSVLVGIIPIVIMFVLYSRVIYTLWFKQQQQAQGTQLAMLKSRKRVTKMVVIVSVVYTVCCLPDFVIHLVIFSGHTNSLIRSIHLIFIILMTCNSAINPFIYTLQSGKFRRHLKRLFCCRSRKIAVISGPRSTKVFACYSETTKIPQYSAS